MTAPASAPKIDTTRPHVARVWDYFHGGKDNYEIDRQVGDQTMRTMPEVVTLARQSRAYLARVVEFLVRDAGMNQFLDIGTGLPTNDNTHQIAQRANPQARIVYVDNDPLVLAHARALLTSTSQGACHYIDADLRNPAHIIDQAARVLNFDRPVALMLMGILEFIPDQGEAREIVRHLRRRLAPGSCLAMYATTDHVNGLRVRDAVEVWNQSGAAPMTIRTLPQIFEFFEGTLMLAPGLVPVHRWRPTHPDPDLMGEPANAYAGIGIIPDRR